MLPDLPDINTIMLSGRLASDGELTVLAGEPVLRLRVNVNQDTFSAEVKGQRAKDIARHTLRGAAVVLTGHLHGNRVGAHNDSRYYQIVCVSELRFFSEGDARQRSLMATEPDK